VCPVATLATAAIASIRLTLAELVRAHGDAYRRTHRLATVQATALRAIAACRTALLGGRRERCDHCGATRLTYNSCRNRHCPTCQSQASARWLEARRRPDPIPLCISTTASTPVLPQSATSTARRAASAPRSPGVLALCPAQKLRATPLCPLYNLHRLGPGGHAVQFGEVIRTDRQPAASQHRGRAGSTPIR